MEENDADEPGSDFELDLDGERPPAESSSSESEEEWEGGGGDEIRHLWTRVYPPEELDQDLPDFTPRRTGPRNLPPRNSAPCVYFYLFFTAELLGHIVNCTNTYARRTLGGLQDWINEHSSSRYRKWVDVTLTSLKKWLGLMINMGLVKKASLQRYWMQKYVSQGTPYFGTVMPFWHFSLISRFFHVNDTDAIPRGARGYDPWHKVRPVLDQVNNACKLYYVPGKEISIDESMIGMKNHIVFLQYMPNKRHCRYGIKKFELCDSTTAYVMHIDLYSGKQFYEFDNEDGLGHSVVMHLMRECQLLNKGYHLFTDNFYTKPKLAVSLRDNGTLLTGTVNRMSRGFPSTLKTARLNVGETMYMRKGPVLTCAFKEKKSQTKPVMVLSTHHTAENVQGTNRRGREVVKPRMILAYNNYMGGVDISDRKVCQYAAERPQRRYWVKIFFNLLDIALMNAYEIYKCNTDNDRKLCRADFITEVLEHLCTDNGGQPLIALPVNVPGAHELQLLPGRRERDCVVCSDRAGGRRKRTRRWCPGCDAGICERCYPRLEHYRRAGRGHQGRENDEN